MPTDAKRVIGAEHPPVEDAPPARTMVDGRRRRIVSAVHGSPLRIAVVAACLAVLTLTAGSAHAAFPGGDGKIAFHTNRDGNFEIYWMSTFGTGQTRLTNNAATDVSPAWSADGTKLAFTSFRDGNNEIYTMNADGTGQTRLTTHGADDVGPAWSPDGTKIVFGTNRDGNGEVYTMNSNGTGQMRITNHAAVDGQSAWSPDGTKIAFTTNRNGQFEIYTMNADGTGQTNITNNAASDTEPNWAPDGSKIVWNRANDVWEMDANGSRAHSVVTNGDNTEPVYNPGNGYLSWATNAYGGNNEIVVGSASSGGEARLTNNAVDDGAPDWQPVTNNYARPKSATPMRIALVPAYKECISPFGLYNSRHKGALDRPSCNPPKPESSYLTVGTPDFNGQAANAAGSVEMKAFCNGGAAGENPPCSATAGDQIDGRVTVSQTDIRCQGPSGGCPNGALSDYLGNLRFEVRVRITDRNSGGAGSATVHDFPVSFSVSCATTGAGIGSTCSSTTSFDAILGGASVITEGKRALWQLEGLKIYDGGNDGVASTQDDNTLFAVGGMFFP